MRAWVPAALLAALLVLLLAYPAAASRDGGVDGLYERLLADYREAVALARRGVDVSTAAHELDAALACIHAGDAACAASHLSAAERLLAEAAGAAEQRQGGWLRVAAAALLLATPLLVYSLLPRFYLAVWRRIYGGWIVDPPGATLAELAAGMGYHGLRSLYRRAAVGEVELRDPRPPRDFLEYLSRLDYSLWLWLAALLASAAAAMAVAGVGGPLAPLRAALGLLLVLFLPGYAAVEALYPERRRLRPLERLVLSVGVSLALTPLTGLVLSYTPAGLRVEAAAPAMAALVAVLLLAAGYRRYQAEARGWGALHAAGRPGV